MRYRLIVSLLLTTWLAVGSAMAGVKVHGNVYGGGNAADVGTDAIVNIGAGQIGVNQVDAEHGNVFGGGKGQVTTVVGDVKVNIGKKVTISNGQTTISYSDDCLVKGSVYGGSALGAVNATKDDNWDEDHLDRISATSGKTTEVNIFAGTVNENVYGGGRGALAVGTEGQTGYEAPIAAESFGPVTVKIGDASVNKTLKVDGSVYGGSDANGVLESNVTVDVIRGTIGKSTTENGTTTITGGNVHGGGYGQPTLVKGDVTVNIGATDGAPTPTYSGSATILGDVYGGSAKGNVNAYINSNVLTVSTYPDPTDELKTLKRETKVNLFGGTISGDLYGGGLGDNTVTPKVAANVYGPVTVTVQGGTVQNVFGCNNKYGSPQDDVVVDIYKTAHTTDNQYPTVTDLNGLNDLSNNDNQFAILAVYGGGNLASYTPPAIGNNSYHSTTVHVYGCTENTVKTVYGGGNAADVGTESVSANTNVIIEGGRFDRIFGGGNGFSETGNHNNPSAANYNPGANIYGTATTEIRGGLFNQVFGGSNQYGNITSATLTINKLCDYLLIKESFGGANEADLSGNVETNLACSDGLEIGTFYGGSNQADIDGNVTLNVYGGTYIDVFGGSKGTTPAANASQTEKDAASADISGNVTLNLYGGTMTNAFGGSDVYGNIGGKITVNMLDREVANCGLTVHNIYGGGRNAAYTPTTPGAYPEVNLIHGTVSKKTDGTGGNVFGGGLGSTAIVSSSPKVTVGYDASMSSLVASLLPANTSLSTASVTVQGDVYGGGEEAAVTGSIVVTVQEGTVNGMTITTAVNGDVYGGGALADTNTDQTTNIGTEQSPAHHSTTVALTGGTVTGSVYGGGLGRNANNTNANNPISAVEAKVYGAVTVTVTGGKATNVFGCNNLNGAPQGTVTVNINGTDTPTAQANYIISNVYGGGNVANYAGTPVVTVTGSSYVENVFGGGNEASVGATDVTINTTANTSSATNSKIAKVFGGGNQAGVTGNTSVSMIGGNVLTAMYGGCNTSGTVGGTSTVDVTGGTIGSAFSAPSKMDDVPDVLFGGGKGAATRITGKTTVTIGSKTTTSGANPTTTYGGTATIYGNVYGGSENGAVSDVDVKLYGTTTGTTNIIYGNVFGGGYDTDASLALNGTLARHAPAAGVVNVLLDGAEFDRTNANNAYMAQIFGCNNKNGTPTGLVTVNVKRTTGSTKTDSTPIEFRAYDVYAVYGGGNMADYKPNGANDSTLVVIEGCDLTSIKFVYGGGNAAAVPATGVEIKGTYIIDKVFGGGNGAGQIPGPNDTMIDNPGANVGSYIVSANNKPTYGKGSAVTKLYGGTINEVYGGSNTLGDIRKVIVETKTPGTSRPDCCPALNVINMYGAGSEAEMTGDVNIIMECSPVAYVDAVYGGAKNAIINGNVTLTVTSGKYGRVFGGNNEGGSINGIITVNVKEDGCDDLEIGELYGAGNQAPYSRFGCTGSNGNWTPNETNTNNFEVTFDQNEQYPYHVRVFVESCTSIGKIFGGGLGTTAKVIGDTYVSVNMMYGSVNNVPKTTLGRIGQVFGGGALADVKGNTKINIGTATANEGEDIGVNIVGTVGTDNMYINPDASQYTSTPYVSVTEAGVYGGGMNANVDGDTEVNIGTADQKLHVGETNECAGITINGNIYGGGYGSGTHVTGNVRVNIGEQNATTSDYVGYANINGDVYGGSAMGKVNSSLVNNVETQTTGKTTQVNFYGGTITGDLYGGGLGDADHAADVYGPVTVNVYEGCSSTANVNNHVNNVFGCNNTNGTPKSTVVVNINGGTVSKSVYGGGNQAIMDGSPVVNVTAGTIGTANQGGAVYGNVYGGGLGSDGTGSETDLNKVKAGLVKGNTQINVSGGTILHNIYGGGAYGSVGTYTYNESTGVIASRTSGGKATINITGGTIGTDGKENGMVFGSSRGNVGAPGEIHDKLAWVYDTEVKIGTQNDQTDGPAIKGSVYGGGENGHNYNNADVYIYSGKIGIDAGDDVTYYDPDDNTKVTYQGKDYNYSYRGNVYGAGCGTDKYWIDADNDNTVDAGEEHFNPIAGIVQGDATITMSGGSVIHNIYGAGAMGSVGTTTAGGVTTITISGGTVGVSGTVGGGNVFGAARGDAAAISNEYALVRDHTTVNISDGTIYGNVYGGGELGCVGRYKFTSDMKEFYWTDQALVANQTSYTYNSTGVCNVTITGGTIGIDGDFSNDHGNVFGGGQGQGDTFWCEKAMVYSTVVNVSKGTVKGDVFGGGEVGRVEQNTSVTIGPASGTDVADIKGDVFGAGKGLDTHGYSALVRGNPTVTVQGSAKVGGSVYGGGEIASVGRHLLVTVDNKEEHPDLEVGMPYTLDGTNVGICTVTVQGNSEITGNVFGAGKGVRPQDITNPGRMTMGGTMEYYDDEAAFLIYVQTLALATDTHVTIGGGTGTTKVKGNVYGGSESGFVQFNTEVKTIGISEIGTTTSGGDIYGGGLGIVGNEAAGRVKGSTNVAITGPATIRGSVYGGGENGIVKESTVVNIGTTGTGGLVFSGTISKDVYGGGKAADVCRNVTVNVNSGTVVNDVYGGGALADTNTDNWDATGNTWASDMNPSTTTGSGESAVTTYNTVYKTIVNLNGGTVGNAYGGGLGQLGTGVHYTQQECDDWNNSTNIQGWITGGTALTEDQAKLVNAALGLSGSAAYVAGGTITPDHAAAYNTTLDGYRTTAGWSTHPSEGAGAIKAIVYGDVIVTVNEEVDATNHTYGTAKITIASEEHTYQKTVRNANNVEEIVTMTGTVYTKGRVFGCNNVNGTPKGNVSVSVWQTIPQEGITQGDIIHTYTEDEGNYEIQGVYGGGNLANYEPASGKQTKVDIHGCGRTSIQYVFGGGNAASVPETHVNIYGTFEIEAVFGGGNGNEPIYSEGHWVQNPGAEVMGNTNVRLMAGLMHQAFGGSFERGIIHGAVNLEKNGEGGEGCDLKITDIFGGGKDADVQAVNIVLSECDMSRLPGVEQGDNTQQIENVYAGSYNARIFGPVTMTIKSGTFKNVFGGNYSGGFINGPITVNVEETSSCKPIKITNLYGGGNYAPYPGAGANNSNPKITVNVKACTSIGNVYGGSFHADVNGDTEVNINMIKGWWAGKTYTSTGDNPVSEQIPNDIGTIGNVYGGGDMGNVIGNAVVNICNLTEIDLVTTPDPDPANNDQVPAQFTKNTNNLYNVLGAKITGNVYGGGNLADVTGITNVTISAVKGNVVSDTQGNPTDYEYTLVNLKSTAGSDYKGVTIGGNVYGGGKGEASNFLCDKAMIGTANDGGANGKGRTFVYIGNGTVGTIENGTLKAETGNVYGGGKIGRVEADTKVTIGYGNGDNNTTHDSAPVIRGSVFGAGQGAATHGYSGLVRGISTVTVQGNAEVEGSVYGGGEMATVGRFWIKNVNNIDSEGALLNEAPEPHADVPTGMPYALMGGGACTVTIQGYAKIGPDNMVMPTFSGNVFGAGKGILPTGYDYQSGTPKKDHYPRRMVLFDAQTHNSGNQAYWEYVDPANSNINKNIWEYFPDEDSYLRFIQTLALVDETHVTIKGNVFVKGSVYGGSENGRVLDDTDVKIQEHCQIGAGYDGNALLAKYDEANFIDPTSATAAEIEANILAECNHWPYGTTVGTGSNAKKIYAPFDKYAHDDGYYYNGTTKPENAVYAEGGMPEGSDGHTFYGNVFGGGSGYFPYKDINGQSKWHSEAGAVGGNTNVTITGGHILTNVYGGNELTNVGNKEDIFTANKGKCTVKMSGGTLGVPRTLTQIADHPVTCYLFGAGKGDQRIFFNKQTNVKEVEVQVSGGIIYGSVFGGGEDGHVMGNVWMKIQDGAKIGTWGTSYVDGNVFGGGRGFGGDAYTAGNVGGGIDVDISGGTMLGSVYGGGRLGSVGYGLYDATITSNGQTSPHPDYGVMREDGKNDAGTDESYFTSTSSLGSVRGRGHVDVNISGGTIGNIYEYIIPTESNIAPVTGITQTDISKWKAESEEGSEWTKWKNYYHVPNTVYDTSNGRLLHTKGGNVFAGGMGRRTKLNGAPFTEDDGIDWTKLGNVKSTKLTISGTNTWIMANVYGGGEFGAVTGSHAATDAQDENIDVGSEIIVTGGTIGTEITESTPQKATVATANTVKYTFGSIYGGGMGSEDHDANDNHGGNVVSNTSVSISGTATKVRASVYGGGEMAAVEHDTHVIISGGEIGRNEVKPLTSDDPGYVMFGGATMGNVYGGGKGHVDHTFAGIVKGNTNVTVSGGNIYHNVYGGGALGSVGTFNVAKDVSYIPDGVPLTPWTSGGETHVTITGGTIGISGRDNGMVDGSSRGDVTNPEATSLNGSTVYKDPYDKVAWIKESFVTIGTENDDTDGPTVKGSVYGGGENGHNAGDAHVTVYSGKIGIFSGEDWIDFGNEEINTKALVTRGNVYGAGCGTDTYWDDADNDGVVDAGEEHNNLWAGIVAGNTYVTVSGGHVANNVYGGGSMGSVGTITSDLDGTTRQHNTGGNTLYNFGLSWPLEIDYNNSTGKANVTIDGSAVIDGYVYGAARGKVEFGESDITKHRYVEAKFANVRETEVVIGTANGTETTPTIHHSVYGGGEDGHVYENASVTIHHGTIDHSVFGGGKGESTFKSTLWDPNNAGVNKKDPSDSSKDLVEGVHSWTAGRVYGNTTVTINDGSVGYFVYGGGNMASVGKGNYAGGADDYATGGYGELPSDGGGNLWTKTGSFDPDAAITSDNQPSTMADYFLSSGKATVNILGGTIGADGSGYQEDGIPYGSVFGGSRGKVAMDVGQLSPRYKYVPDFFLGYVNRAIVNIGGTAADALSAKSPTIHGSVYGGGQDGHVRNSTEVHIFKGSIAGEGDTEARSGHVFGAGSGIGTYEGQCYNSSGSVTCTTLVEVVGGSIAGNVYGGGAMASVGPPKMGPTDELKAASGTHKSHSYTKVEIKGGSIGGSVFAASRGPSDNFIRDRFTDTQGNSFYDPTKFATDIWSDVHVSGGTISGSVYGGGETGQVKCDVNVNITGGTITGDVYGGGALSNTNTSNLKQDKNDNNIWKWTDTTNKTAKYKTIVNVLGGTVGKYNANGELVSGGDVYGGGLGRFAKAAVGTPNSDGYKPAVTAVEAKVYGDVKVNLNGLEEGDYDADIHGATTGDGVRMEQLDNNDYQIKNTVKGAIISRVFGCNNLLGSPQGKVRVHVFGTQNVATTATAIAEPAVAEGQTPPPATNKVTGRYDVAAVYGGGNLAAYTPMGPDALRTSVTNFADIVDDYLNTEQKTEVIIDGCHRTSIKQVYGGGNAASVPATFVEVNGTFEINEVFGGGNGDTNYTLVEGDVTKYYQNPGANVGYRNYTTVDKTSATGADNDHAYPVVENTDAATKELRQANYAYGSGVATTEIKGGKMHNVYGGSNKKGNIRTTALSIYEGMFDDCPMEVDESYGGGKDAPIDGEVDVKMKCATGVKELFGGSKNSDVNSNINLTITNGSSLEKVFGGNNTSGAIAGSITVNVEEGGCEPIHIGELYLGGYLAPYSVYGYEEDGYGSYTSENINYGDELGTIPQRIPITKKRWEEVYRPFIVSRIQTDEGQLEGKTDAEIEEDDDLRLVKLELEALRERLNSYPKKDPRINIISASRIDNVFGGGYRALVVGNPHINVNMTTGRVDKEFVDEHSDFVGTHTDPTTGVVLYKGEGTYANGDGKLAIGTIGNIYGGGNEAAVYGNTYLEIGTGEWLNRDDQREILGTTTTINTPTTFTYDESSKKWRYDKTTTAPVAVTGTINPAEGSTIPETPADGQTVQGTCEADGITTPTTFTYVKPDGSESGYWTYLKTTTTIESIDGTPTPVRYTAKIDGDVFGGGNLGDIGQTHEDSSTGSIVDVIDMKGNTSVIIGARKAVVNNEEVWQGVAEATMVEDNDGDITGVSITGNVYGGGQGQSTTFRCGHAMVTGGTNIVIGNGTVKRTQRDISTDQTPKYEWTGTIYGGGKIGRVEENTSVTIGLGDGEASGTPTSAPVIEGSVFGAGAGVNTHGYSALVRGSSTVNVQGNAKIGHSVYGGGEVASVGRYNIGADGLPVTLVDPTSSTSGHCIVNVKGYAEIGPDNMKMKKEDGSDPDDTGYVFGAGKGVLPFESITDPDGRPGRMLLDNSMDYYYGANPEKVCTEAYSKYLRTLALATQTDVTITGHAFVKGSVYGGAENGFVQFDTHVVIDGDCQIGNGEGVNRRYTDEEWAQGKLLSGSEEMLAKYSNSLPECASWPYGQEITVNGQTKKIFAPYDKYAMTTAGHEEEYEDDSSTNGGRRQGSDGHTFFGNVFGGGSGYWPYAPGKWYEYAGSVYGNTIVDIKGGHILTSAYGGNELTNVGRYNYTVHDNNTTIDIELLSGGNSYVTMTGGTVGVPRTLGEMTAHPVTCYLFGSGKGDQRTFFNTATNVGNAFVHVSDNARIYGSVFGGGEDGHVIKDAKLSIGSKTILWTLPTKSVFYGTELSGGVPVGEGNNAIRYPLIGTIGTSYVDGNVFGAGRGYSGEALTAGSVGGNAEVNIKDGTMLGSVYGGGRMASVGTLFTTPTDPYYGQLQEDDGTNIHGHIIVNISGGTIGNDQEDILVKHTKGGNVFGGSMGKLELQDGSINKLWPKMAVSKTTKVNISGNALIKSNVYGGGEFSMVRGDTYVTIGGVLGDDNETITSTNSDAPTIKRDVYGGGYGSDDFNTHTEITAGGFDATTYTFTPMQMAGIVCGDTYVNMKRGWVMKNVYGGGEMATVGLIDFTNAEKHRVIVEEGTSQEKVYGFGLSWPYKMDFITHDGTNIGGTTHVNVYGGRLGITGKDFIGPFDDQGRPLDVSNNNAVLDPDNANDAKKIKNARKDNGDIYGGGKGLAGDRYDYAFCANVKNTNVTIEYPSNNGATPENYKTKDGDTYTYDCIAGAVYGGGENGHVIGDTHVTLKKGLIGHAIYGGGSGKGQYEQELFKIGSTTEKHSVNIYSVTAGKVYGNTKVEMEGGYVVRNIYGGGNMGSVGKGNYASGTDDYYPAGYGETLQNAGLWTPTSGFKPDEPIGESNQPTTMADYFLSSGKTEIIVTGGQVGYVDTSKPSDSMKDGLPYGNIFGGCRGESAPNIQESPRHLYSPEFFSGYVNETKVVIGKTREEFTGDNAAADYAAYTGPKILGSVYGGGQDGHVRRDTHIIVNKGDIGLPFTDTWRTKFGKTDGTTLSDELDNPQWLFRGNVFGAGSGIGKYQYDFNGNKRYTKEEGQDEEVEANIEVWNYVNPVTNRTTQMKEIDFSTSAGSVTRFTKVEVNGGTIHRNVYGGGSLASVGPPAIPPTRTDFADKKGDTTEGHGPGWQSLNEVIIKGTIGTPDGYGGNSNIKYVPSYGGEVYGASRGDLSIGEDFGVTVWTQVFIKNGAHIMGNVFGGGDNGKVKRDSEVFIGEPATTSDSGTSDDSGSGGNTGSGDNTGSGNP